MRLLLDTHAFLWFIEDNPHLSTHARKLLESDTDLCISIASLWEIAIKINIGKLTLAQPFEAFIPAQIEKNAIEPLPITVEHLAVVTTLALHHRDPFDRLLIAQATVEQLPIISGDSKFDLYNTHWETPLRAVQQIPGLNDCFFRPIHFQCCL